MTPPSIPKAADRGVLGVSGHQPLLSHPLAGLPRMPVAFVVTVMGGVVVCGAGAGPVARRLLDAPQIGPRLARDCSSPLAGVVIAAPPTLDRCRRI